VRFDEDEIGIPDAEHTGVNRPATMTMGQACAFLSKRSVSAERSTSSGGCQLK